MREYLDKETGLWKLGKDGEPKFRTREACREEFYIQLAERLKKLKERIEYAK
jgi:hypothetical protein